MKNWIIVLSTAMSLVAQAQTGETQAETAARVKSAMDSAYSQAKQAQATHNATGVLAPPPAPSVTDLRSPSRADPLALAKAYEAKRGALKKPEQDLLIFISTSMPRKTLQLLGLQAEKTGAVLVLRGIKGKLGTPGAIDDTIKAIEPAAATGATVRIDPEQFSRYDVTAVPTFVIARRQEGCAFEQCVDKAYSLVGDVSLDYALETWVKRGGEAGQLAKAYLARLDREKPP